MDKNDGGLVSLERQRKAAAEIARKKVLGAYERAENQHKYQHSTAGQEAVTKENWQKYHSAWQKYYQNYYNDYYARMARNYVARERLKQQRAIEDERKILGEDFQSETPVKTAKAQIINDAETGKIIGTMPTAEKQEQAGQILRQKIHERAREQLKKTRKNKHLVPILAGIAVVLIFLFLQYNRMIFAPIAAYISPGNNESTSITPIDATVARTVSSDPKLIIPKLNVDVPVHFGISNNEATVMSAMNDGVAQFAIPGANAMPGQIGNLVITGHSAGDIYSNNQYKFIFSGLERLSAGDLIYINYNSKRYTYTMTKSEVVEPTDIAALTKPTTEPTLILVTCTPLGTSRYRLLLFAKQIDPELDNKTETQNSNPATNNNDAMPANEPSFFESIWNFLTGKQR